MRDERIGCDAHKRYSQLEVRMRNCSTHRHYLRVHESLLP